MPAKKVAKKVKKIEPAPIDTRALDEATKSRLGAQLEALGAFRAAADERLSHVAEQIGELRAQLAELQREQRESLRDAQKATQLVASVQPERLRGDVQKQDAKIEVIGSRVQALQSLLETIRHELADMRSAVSAFRGLDEVISLNKESSKALHEARKNVEDAKSHADAVEHTYASMKKRFDKFEEFEKVGEQMRSLSAQTTSALTELRSKAEEYVKKEDLARVESEVQDTAELTLEDLNELKHQLAELHTSHPAEHVTALKEEVAGVKTSLLTLQSTPANEDLRGQVITLKREIAEMKSLFETAQKKPAVDSELREEVATLRRELLAAKASLHTQQPVVDKQLRGDVILLKQDLADTKSLLDYVQKKSHSAEMQEQIISTQQQLNEVKSALRTAPIDALRGEIATLKQETMNLKSSLNLEKNSIDLEARDRITVVQENITEVKTLLQESRSKNKSLLEELGALQKRLAQLEQYLRPDDIYTLLDKRIGEHLHRREHAISDEELLRELVTYLKANHLSSSPEEAQRHLMKFGHTEHLAAEAVRRAFEKTTTQTYPESHPRP